MQTELKRFFHRREPNVGADVESQLGDSQMGENSRSSSESYCVQPQQNTSIKVNASVISNRDIYFISDKIELNQRVHAGQKVYILANNQVVNRNRLTANEGSRIEAEEFFNEGARVEFFGEAAVFVRRFINRTVVVGGGNPWDQYPVQRAIFHAKGSCAIDASECAENVGGEIIIDGDGKFTSLFPNNTNIQHLHEGCYEVRVPRRRFLGMGASTKRAWQPFCNTICDSGAHINAQGELSFDVRNDLVNQGNIEARAIKGRAKNLVNELLSERGFGPIETNERVNRHLATIRAETDLNVEFDNIATNRGVVSAGDDLEIRTKQLKAAQELLNEKMLFAQQGGLFSSDKVRYEPTTRSVGGGEFHAGGNNRMLVQETAELTGARVTAGKDIDWNAANMELKSQKELQRVDLPGRSSLFKSRNLHALHANFTACEFDAGGKAKVVARKHLTDEAARISGAEGAELQAQSATYRVPFAINKVREDRGWTRSTDQYEVEQIVPRIISTTGNASASTSKDHAFTGAVIAPLGVAKVESTEGSVHLNAHIGTVPGRISETSFNFFSLTRAVTDVRRDAVVPSVVFGKGVLIRAKSEICGTGVQIQAIDTLHLKAQRVRLTPCYANQFISIEGCKLGLSFSGFQILEAFARGLDSDEILKAVLQSDPAIAAAFRFIEARTGVARAYRGLRMAISQWELACARLSEQGQCDSIPLFFGKRTGIFDEAGRFAPKAKLTFQMFSEDHCERDVFIAQLSAGSQLIIEADWQELQGLQLDAKCVNLSGIDGNLAEQITLKSAQSQSTSAKESDELGITFSTRSKISATPDISFAHSEGASSSSAQHNSTVAADHLDIRTKRADLTGAHIHTQSASGHIDHLELHSQFDRNQSDQFYASVSTSGDFAFSQGRHRESTIAQPTSFSVEQRADLFVGFMHLSGAVSKNLDARDLTHNDLTEFRSTRSIDFALNVKALLDVVKRPKANRTDNVRSSSLISDLVGVDPMLQKAFRDVGSAEWEILKENRDLRATGLGSSSAPTLNRDESQSRGDWQGERSQGGVPFILFDQGLWNCQLRKIFGDANREAQFQEQRAKSELERDLAPEKAAEDERVQISLLMNISQEVDCENAKTDRQSIQDIVLADNTDFSGSLDIRKIWSALQSEKKRLNEASEKLKGIEAECRAKERLERADQIAINSAQISVHQAEMCYLNCSNQFIDAFYNRIARPELSRNFSEEQLADKLATLRTEKEKVYARMTNSNLGIGLIEMELQSLMISMRAVENFDGNQIEKIGDLLFQLNQMHNINKSAGESSAIVAEVNDALEEPLSDELYLFVTAQPKLFVNLLRDLQKIHLGRSRFEDKNQELFSQRFINPQTFSSLDKLVDQTSYEKFEKALEQWSYLAEQNRQGSVLDSYYQNLKSDPVVGSILKPLPEWNLKAQNLCDELWRDNNKSEVEKIDAIKGFVRNSIKHEVFKRRGSSENYEKHLNNLEATYLHICHNFVMLDNFYYKQPVAVVGDKFLWKEFESARDYPSRLCYYCHNMSAIEAKATHYTAQDVQIMFVGGLFNYRPSDYQQIMELLSKAHGNRPVESVFNSRIKGRRSGLSEILDGARSLFSNDLNLAILLTASAVRSNLKSNKKGILHIVAHSHGGIILKHALDLLEPRERERLYISTIGSGKMISKSECPNAINYVNKGDLVGQGARLLSFLSNKEYSIKVLNPYNKEDSFAQHKKTSSSYIIEINEAALDIIKKLGFSQLNQKRELEQLRLFNEKEGKGGPKNVKVFF